MISGEIFAASGEIAVRTAEGMFMAKKVTVYSQPG
jgi:hypothetical protein